MANKCGTAHGLFDSLFGCSKCQRINKAKKKYADNQAQTNRTTTSARAGLVKDEQWHRNKSIQSQFPNGW